MTDDQLLVSALNHARFCVLGTHDVQRVEIADNLSLSVDYIEGSQAKGVLCLLLLRTPEGGLDLHRSVQVIMKKGSDDILQIPGGTYMVLAFDVESDGLLQQEELFPASTEDDHTVSGTNTGSNVSSPEPCIYHIMLICVSGSP